MKQPEICYLVSDERDEAFGITVTTVGKQIISPAQSYPPTTLHPSGYLFNPQEGRILDEYQLLYITGGDGTFESETYGAFNITEGRMILLFPGVRHKYAPSPNSGWTEHWIGFRGSVIENLLNNQFISPEKPILNIGHNERIVDLYYKAIGIATEERAGYQQALGGIVLHLIGLAYYRNHSSIVCNEEHLPSIEKAKLIMRSNIYGKIQLEEVAEQVNMGYSNFRKYFKEFTGLSPAYFFQELKINEAKLLLSTTNQSIKEISFNLNFETPEYFSTFFKKRTTKTPLEYRISSK